MIVEQCKFDGEFVLFAWGSYRGTVQPRRLSIFACVYIGASLAASGHAQVPVLRSAGFAKACFSGYRVTQLMGGVGGGIAWGEESFEDAKKSACGDQHDHWQHRGYDNERTDLLWVSIGGTIQI
ncbi:hypothetical protein N9X53_08630, partial [Mariniblastus sp.]|nr:hypothetical protein [Mariniblastus sp.]